MTDFLIAVACVVFAARLSASDTKLLWALGFALGAISATAGGIYHGFPSLRDRQTGRRLWSATLLTFGASCCAFSAGAMIVAFPTVRYSWMGTVAALAFVCYAFVAARNDSFSVGGVAALLTLIPLGFMAAALAQRGSVPGATLIAANIGLTIAGVVVQLRHLAPHPRFNHNDLFHVFQLAALVCLYLGIQGLP